MSADIHQGMQLKIPCTTQNGAFGDEYLIAIETANEVISGFIGSEAVSEDAAGNRYIIGVVHEVKDDTVVIRLPGSFFTTTGLAYFSQQQLEGYQS